MRKVILYIAASLDNYIAMHDGDINWLHSHDFELPEEDFSYQELYEEIDTTLMGQNTYKIIQWFDIPFPYPDKINYVFCRQPNEKDTECIKIIRENVANFVRRLKLEKGKDIWLVGGGQINTLLLERGLIDRIILTIIPVFLGQGIPLFSELKKEINFEMAVKKSYANGFLQIVLNEI